MYVFWLAFVIAGISPFPPPPPLPLSPLFLPPPLLFFLGLSCSLYYQGVLKLLRVS